MGNFIKDCPILRSFRDYFFRTLREKCNEKGYRMIFLPTLKSLSFYSSFWKSCFSSEERVSWYIFYPNIL